MHVGDAGQFIRKMNPFMQSIVERFEALRDAEISGWSGVEMALSEGREDGEIWEDPSVPCLQLLFIDVAHADGTRSKITTVQLDDIWGLCVDNPSKGMESDAHWDGIYRKSALSCLPSGRVKNVDVEILDGVIAGVGFLIGESHVQIFAGEVYEECDGNFRIVKLDESVLVRMDGKHPRIDGSATPNKDVSAFSTTDGDSERLKA